jgi:proteasome lid subunit RPN8/RPN11
MTQGAYRQTMAALGSRSPEAAGILLGPKEDEPFATHFVLDTCGIATSVSFRLDVEHLNKVLARFRQCDLTCVGIVHSHPTGIQAPSHGDLEYVERVLGHEDNDETSVFLFPIFCDGRLHPYILCRTKSLPRIAPAALMLV